MPRRMNTRPGSHESPAMMFHCLHAPLHVRQSGRLNRDFFATRSWISAPNKRAHGGTYMNF
jgi:hypothetical protein